MEDLAKGSKPDCQARLFDAEKAAGVDEGRVKDWDQNLWMHYGSAQERWNRCLTASRAAHAQKRWASHSWAPSTPLIEQQQSYHPAQPGRHVDVPSESPCNQNDASRSKSELLSESAVIILHTQHAIRLSLAFQSLSNAVLVDDSPFVPLNYQSAHHGNRFRSPTGHSQSNRHNTAALFHAKGH